MPLHGIQGYFSVLPVSRLIMPMGRATAVVAQTAAAVLQELRTKAKLRGVAISPTSTGSKLQLSVALANNSLEVGAAAGKLVVKVGRVLAKVLAQTREAPRAIGACKGTISLEAASQQLALLHARIDSTKAHHIL